MFILRCPLSQLSLYVGPILTKIKIMEILNLHVNTYGYSSSVIDDQNVVLSSSQYFMMGLLNDSAIYIL